MRNIKLNKGDIYIDRSSLRGFVRWYLISVLKVDRGRCLNICFDIMEFVGVIFISYCYVVNYFLI